MNEIYIKAFFGDWKKVTKEEAKKYCEYKMKYGIPAVAGKEQKIKIINEKHLKGITYEELQKIEVYEQTTLF